MLRRKSSSSGGNKKDEKGAHDQGGIPSVSASQDSEGACGQSPSPSEDKVQTKQSQYTDGREQPDGSGSSRITRGHTLSKKEKEEKKERKEAKKRERDKQIREKKEAEQQEKERKEREKQKEKEQMKIEKQKTRNASQSKQRNSSSQDAQPPVSPNESHLPQEHHNPSEGSQGSQGLAGIEDTTLEEGTKQTSSEAQGDSMQTATVDEPPVFMKPESGQMTASKDEKDKRIAELEEQKKRLAEELEETKSNKIQKLETEIEHLQAKETEFNTQHQEHMNDLRAALQRKHDEIEKLTHDHASEMKVMQDDHSKRISQLHQERKQSESEKDEEAKRLKQKLQEKDKVNQEIEEKIKLLRRESVQLKEKLKEKEGSEEELCPLPPNHHLEEIKKQKEELENKHALELSQLEAVLKEKEEKCREEADKLCQELEVTKEKHANNVEQLHRLKQKDERVAYTLRQELKDASEKHADEVRRLQTALKDKDEQEVTKLRLELEELTEKNAKEVQQLKAELEEKEAQYTKAIADVKAEYEDKHKAEERYKEAEIERKVKRQEAVSSGVLREKKNEIEKLKKECEDKDNAIVGLTEKLNKMKGEYEQKEFETLKQVKAITNEIKKLQREQRKHVAEASKKQKEHDQLIEIKTKEIEFLRNKLHQVSKEAPETVQRLQEQLQEKDCELNTAVTEIKTLQNHYETLTAEHEHLQHLHGQLKVELKMKRELDECNEYSSSSNPSNTTVIEPLNQHPSDTRTTKEERDFQSASESSFTEQVPISDQLQHTGDSRSEEKEFHSNEIDHQNKQRQAAREQGGGEYDESHRKYSQPEQIVKFPLSVLNEYGQLQSHSEPQSTEVDPEYREGRITRLERESVIVRGNSAECRTLIDLTSELRLAIRSELISLTGSLLSARLISLDNDDELRNTAHSEIDRSARLVWLIQNKVRQNPRHYHSFIDILQGNQDQFKDILQQLKQTYQKHQHKDGYTRT